MKYSGTLDAGGRLSNEAHQMFLHFAFIGERLATCLHAVIRGRIAEKAAIKEILESGHDVDSDGSIFDCSACWQAAIEFRRKGFLAIPAKAPRNPELW